MYSPLQLNQYLTEWEMVRTLLYPIRPKSKFMQSVINKDFMLFSGNLG